jgi:hypothetical protein
MKMLSVFVVAGIFLAQMLPLTGQATVVQNVQPIQQPVQQTVDIKSQAIDCGLLGLLTGCDTVAHIADSVQEQRRNETVERMERNQANLQIQESNNQLALQTRMLRWGAVNGLMSMVIWVVVAACITLTLLVGIFSYKETRVVAIQNQKYLIQERISYLEEKGNRVVVVGNDVFRITNTQGNSIVVPGQKLLELKRNH